MAAPAGTSDPIVPLAVAGPASAQSPSIEILANQSQLAGTCGGQTFDLNTFINVDAQASADVKLSVVGAGTIEQFVDETGTNIGPFRGVYSAFHIKSFGGGLPPNTPIQITITTYSGPASSGVARYVSTLTFDCTTGVILRLTANAPGDPQPIPTLSVAALIAMAGLLALLGAPTLRKRKIAPFITRR